MRIRRRPQALPLEQQPSDPFTAPHPPPPPPPPPNAWLPLPGEEAEQGIKRIKSTEELHPRRPDADPGPAALPSGPQGGNVVGRSSSSSSDDDDDPLVHGHGGGAQRQRAAAAPADGRTHGHESLPNGHRDESERPVISAGERLVNGVIPAMPVVPMNVKEAIKNDQGGGAKKRRRGPAVLMEGSRCSRVNGRGWRCSQPTLVGYSLCDHHLGKGRQRSASRTEPSRWKNGAATLGRTEPSIRKKAAQPSVPVLAAASTADGRAGAPKLGRTDPASSRNNVDALAVVAAAARDASDLPSLRASPLAAEVD